MNICLLQSLQWEEGSRSYPFPELRFVICSYNIELKATEKQQ